MSLDYVQISKWLCFTLFQKMFCHIIRRCLCIYLHTTITGKWYFITCFQRKSEEKEDLPYDWQSYRRTKRERHQLTITGVKTWKKCSSRHQDISEDTGETSGVDYFTQDIQCILSEVFLWPDASSHPRTHT